MKFTINNKIYHTRKCHLSDFNFVYDLHKKTLFRHISKYVDLKKKIFRDNYVETYKHNSIIMRGKRRVGLFKIRHEKNHTEVDRIYLSPAYHGKGIGAYFMLYFEQLAKKKGHKKIKLQCWDNNPACKFYKKFGYKKIKIKNHKVYFEKRI